MHRYYRRRLPKRAGRLVRGGGGGGVTDSVADSLSLFAGNASSGTAYVSALKVREQTDGVGPFDADDEAGNDSSESNLIVRSFDQVGYTLEYVTELSDPTKPADTASINVRLTLPMSPIYAQFDDQSLNWMIGKTLTYYYSDGTSSTSLDKNKSVVKQVLSGQRILEGKSSDDKVPGAGQLSIGIGVKAAPNGTVLQPSFELQSEGTGQIAKVSPDPVTVSAFGRYNIVQKDGSQESARNPYYVNYDDGSVTMKDTEGRDKGRIYAHTVGIALWNTSADKGLKGLELPQGDITFDLKTTALLNDADVTGDEDAWGVRLWDYHVSSGETRGKLNRNMSLSGRFEQAAWESSLPLGKFRGPNIWGLYNGVYDSGDLIAVQDADDPHVLHVTIKDYAFDIDKWIFPYAHAYSDYSYRDWTDNVGFFSVGCFQYFARYPRVVDKTLNYRVDTVAENMSVTSSSGMHVTSEERTTDNTVSNQVVLYAPGSFTKHVYHDGDTTWNSDDAWIAPGQTRVIRTVFSYTGTDQVRAYDQLIKFDTEAFDAASWADTSVDYPDDVIGSRKIFFAAKKDGTGWVSDTEMNRTRSEGLIYYDSLDSLLAAGKTCVGVLCEARDSLLVSCRSSHQLMTRVKCKADATPGYVAQAVSDVRLWTSTGKPGSVTDTKNDDGSYGLGDSNWTEGMYPEGYTPPEFHQWFDYEKQIYKNGAQAGGHKGGNQWGHSILIVGGKNSININVADKTVNDETKSVYDLDAGEREATFTISPAIRLQSENGSATGSGNTTDATVTVALPKGLSYKVDSATREIDSVKVNDDGTTTLTTTYKGVTIGELLPPFNVTAIIGQAGTSDDVANNQQLTAKASIASIVDQRAVSKMNGTIAESTIAVVKLAAVSASKSVTPEHGNLGASHAWTLNFGNSSQTEITDCVLADVMPYAGDSRGSSFSGAYTTKRIRIDLSQAPRLLADIKDTAPLSYSGDSSARDNNGDPIVDGNSSASFSSLGIPVIENGNVLVWDNLSLTNEQLKAFRLQLGNFYGNEYMSIEISIDTADSSGNLLKDAQGNVQKRGDEYVNNFVEYANGQAAVVHSNVVKTRVDSADISVKKEWAGDSNGNEKFRPSSIVVTVSGTDGSKRDLTTLSEANSWSGGFSDLPRYKSDGSMITYSVAEPNVSKDYSASVVGNENDGFTITNTYTYKATGSFEISGTKNIIGRDFADGDSMTFTITGAVEGDASAKCPFPSNVDSNGNLTISPKNGMTAALNFGTVKIDSSLEGKTLVYNVRESSASGQNMGKDEHTGTVKYKITDPNHDGTLKATLIDELPSDDALTFINIFTPTPIKANVDITKKLVGRDWTASDKFMITVTPIATDSVTVDDVKNAMPDVSGLGFIKPASGDTSTLSVNGFTFKKAGVYRYDISEKIPSGEKKGIEYDNRTLTIEFNVVQNAKSGILSVSSSREWSDESDSDVSFINTYSAVGVLSGLDNLRVTKSLVGRDWKDTDAFMFGLSAGDTSTIVAEAKGYVKFPDTAAIRITRGEQSKSFGDVIFTKPGAYKLKIAEKQHDVPGVDIDVPCVLSVNVTDNGDGTLSPVIVSGNSNPSFTDTYGAGASVSVVLNGMKVLSHDGYENVPDISGKYEFTLQEQNGTPSGSFAKTAKNDSKGIVSFGSTLYTMNDLSGVKTASDGTRSRLFTYTISENGNVNGITNDDDKNIEFAIVDDGNGNIIAKTVDSENGAFTFVNTFEASATTSLSGTKTFVNQPDDFDKPFQFVLAPSDDETARSIENGNIVIPESVSDVVGAGDYSFDGIQFKYPGTYTFTLNEKIDESILGVTFDDAQRIITFNVTETGTSEMNVETSVDGGTLDFVNLYSASGMAAITANKELAGAVLKDGQFEFELLDDNGTVIDTEANDATGLIEFAPLKYSIEDNRKNFAYTIREKHGDDTNIDYDVSEHNVQVNVTDNGDGTLKCEIIYDDKDDNKHPVFHNVYNEPVVPQTKQQNDNNETNVLSEMISETFDNKGIVTVTMMVLLSIVSLSAFAVTLLKNNKRNEN